MEDYSPLRPLQPGWPVRWFEVKCDAYREPLGGVHFNHTAQQILTVWRDEVRHVENSQLHLLQKVPQVVIVKRQSALEEEERRKHVSRLFLDTFTFWIWLFNVYTSLSLWRCNKEAITCIKNEQLLTRLLFSLFIPPQSAVNICYTLNRITH